MSLTPVGEFIEELIARKWIVRSVSDACKFHGDVSVNRGGISIIEKLSEVNLYTTLGINSSIDRLYLT